MKILLVIRSLGLGGAERQFCNLAIGMHKNGHEVNVVSLGKGGAFATELVHHAIYHQSLGHRGPRDFVRSGVRLRSMVSSLDPDVVYSFLPVSNVLCAAFLPTSARARLVWGVRASSLEGLGYGFFPRLVLRFERWLSHRPQLIIPNSEAGANYHSARGYPIARIRVVENSVDFSTFNYSAALRTAIREELGIAVDKTIVALVARIDIVKGYETFLRAAAMICGKRKDVEFWSVGGGDARLRNELQDLACKLGIESQLVWHGEVRDPSRLVALMCAADLAVSASLSEGFPNAVAEAMACGLRVVGTNAGDTRRIVGDFGECIPPADPTAMCEAILRQLEIPSGREEVRGDLLARFEPSGLMSKHEGLLREVAATSAYRGK